MNNVTISLSPDTAKKLLAICEEEIAALERQLVEKRREYEQIKKAASMPIVIDRSPESNRARKGEAREAVVTVLKSRKGERLSHKQISDITGAAMSSVYRALRLLAKEGAVQTEHGRYFIP